MAVVNDDLLKRQTLANLGFRVCVSTVTHPFELARFLMQIGHEPMPPYPTRTFFGKKTTALPNVFRYVSYIKNTDGLVGLYRGFGPKLAGQIISSLLAEKATENINVPRGFDPKKDEVSDEERWLYYKQTFIRDLAGKTVTIVISQPFYVISSRMMAQFIGGEEIYNGFLASVREIYNKEGILGFFNGLVPRWLGEFTTLLLSSVVIYGVNKYLIQDQEIMTFMSASTKFIAAALTYPFSLVTACIVVNNCGLAAGQPPQMPVFDNWTHCWRHLHQIGQLNRGSSTLYRYAPTIRNPIQIEAKTLSWNLM